MDTELIEVIIKTIVVVFFFGLLIATLSSYYHENNTSLHTCEKPAYYNSSCKDILQAQNECSITVFQEQTWNGLLTAKCGGVQ
jgi:hypothetical protein